MAIVCGLLTVKELVLLMREGMCGNGQLPSQRQHGAQLPPGLELGRELRVKGMSKGCSSGQA